MNHPLQKSAYAIFMCLLGACAVGPDYVRPKVETPAAFKEAKGWKQAEPKDEAPRGPWWNMLTQWDTGPDRELDALEKQIDISNQNLKQAEGAYRQAQGAVSVARASFFPQITAGYSDIRGNSQPTQNFLGFNTPGVVSNDYTASLSASWELDVWGRIRRTVESKDATSQATEADLQSARLSAQADLATEYIGLRFVDEQKRLLDTTAENDAKTLQYALNMYKSGVGRISDVVQARAKLDMVKAQAIDTLVERAQHEHAIAVLIGKAPSDFSIPVGLYVPLAPDVPPGLPSEMIERRPDVASAERKVAAANAQIGVAQAAYFPTLTLNASAGFQSYAFEHFSQLLSIPQRFWSIGPSFNLPIFDGGMKNAQKDETIAAYDQAVAVYRQTVLNGFREVEDNLAGMHILRQEEEVQQRSVASSREAVKLLLNLYKAESGRYMDVLMAQNDELTSELNALSTQKQQLMAVVALVKALGGGWESLEKK